MDLVKWLRVHATGDDFSDDLMEQAANEIERLREDRKRLRAALSSVIPYVDTCNADHRAVQERACAALEEGE